MTYELFEEWLIDFDQDMGRQGRKIVLLMDNAPGHGVDRSNVAVAQEHTVQNDAFIEPGAINALEGSTSDAPVLLWGIDAAGERAVNTQDGQSADAPIQLEVIGDQGERTAEDLEEEEETGGLRNIRLIRLPPKTTSVSQPLDAGIIRSFKVKYGRQMIQVLSAFQDEAKLMSQKAEENRKLAAERVAQLQRRAEQRALGQARKNEQRTRRGLPVTTPPPVKSTAKQETPKKPRQPAIPNRRFYPCLINAWDRVTAATIRNCFAHVPTIPRDMADQIRMAVEEDRDLDMIALKEDLKRLYPARSSMIERQKDFGILAFLKSCDGRGPQPRIMEAIKSISTRAEFQHMFLPPDRMAILFEDETEDDSDDLDFEPSDTEDDSPRASTMGTREMQLKGGKRSYQFPESLSSSQESSDQLPDKPLKTLKKTLRRFSSDLEQKTLSVKVAKNPRAREWLLSSVTLAQRLIETIHDGIALGLESHNGYYDGVENFEDESDTTAEDTTGDFETRLTEATALCEALAPRPHTASEDKGEDEDEDDILPRDTPTP